MIYEAIFPPKFFVTHPKNRAGAMLIPTKAHATSAKVNKIGASFDALKNAYATELDPSDPTYLELNKALVSKSGGLLAPVTGAETFATLLAASMHCDRAAPHSRAVNLTS